MGNGLLPYRDACSRFEHVTKILAHWYGIDSLSSCWRRRDDASEITCSTARVDSHAVGKRVGEIVIDGDHRTERVLAESRCAALVVLLIVFLWGNDVVSIAVGVALADDSVDWNAEDIGDVLTHAVTRHRGGFKAVGNQGEATDAGDGEHVGLLEKTIDVAHWQQAFFLALNLPDIFREYDVIELTYPRCASTLALVET